jgi:WD40 repeat protein
MARVFVSHSSRDADSAARLKEWLVAQGFDAPFLDFDKHSGIPPGADWERTLYRELSTSEAMLIVQTPNWSESKWCFAEFTQARALGKPIFPVIDAQPGGNLVASDIQALDLTRDRESGLAQLARELTRIALDAQGGFAWDAKRPPYPGLLAFQAEDAAVYFGRDDDIRRLIERLNARRVQGGAGIVAVLGASGSGKSSLLRAGVLPRLARDKRGWIVVPPFRPQLHPLDELSRVMAIAAGRPTEWRAMRDGLLGDDPVRALGDWVHDLRTAASANEAQVLLTVDQAEELWSTADKAEALRFEQLIAAAAKSSLPLMVVLAQRSDFLESLQRSEALGGTFEEFSLGPLPLARVPQIIEGPARVAGLEVEDALLQEATRDAATDDALPLLAFALRALHDRFGQDGKLSLDEYRALGDPAAGLSPLENAVRRAADEVLAAAKPGDAELRALKEAFVPALVRVNDAGEYVRRPALWTDLPTAAHDLLERLAKARLLIRRQAGEASVVEVAHEALLRKWPRLRKWLDEQRTFLIGRQQLEQDVRDWQQVSPADKPKALLAGLKLARAENWLLERPQQLSADERQYIQASVERARAEARRRARARLFITLSSAAAAVVLAIAAAYAWQQSEQAVAERVRALDLARVALATDLQERDATKAALILNEIDNPDTELIARKLDELLRLPLLRAELAHDAPVSFVAFNRGGNRIVTIAGDHAVRVWDAATSELLTGPLAHEEVVTAATVSPDGAMLLTVAGDTVRVFDVASSAVRQTWAYGGPVLGAEFLASGKRVAIAVGPEVWVRDIETGEPVFKEPWRHAADVTGLATAPKQDRVATATADDRISVWDAGSGAAVDVGAPLGLKDVRQLTWSPSGEELLAVSWSGMVLWDARTGERWSSEEGASSAWFAEHGRRFIAAGPRESFLWDQHGGELQSKPVAQGAGRLLATAFRNETEVLTLSGTGFNDHGIYRFSIYGVPRQRTVLALSEMGSADSIRSSTLATGGDLIAAAFAQEAGLLATLSGKARGGGRAQELMADTTVRLWNVTIGITRPSRSLPGSNPVLSPDGTLVATIDDAAVSLQRIADGSSHPLGPLRHESRVISAAFRPDGAMLAVQTDVGISVHSLADGSVKVIKGAPSGSIAFTTDGHLIWARGGYGVADVWGAATGASVLPTAPGCSDTSESMIDPAGRVLLRVCGDQINAWTRRNDRFEGPKPLPYAMSWKVAISPTSPVVAVAVDQTIELWDTATGSRRQRVELDGGAYRVAFAPDGTVIAAAIDGGDNGATVAIVDVGKGVVLRSWPVERLDRLEFTAGGGLVVADQVDNLTIWQVDDGAERGTVAVTNDADWALDASGHVLMTSSGRTTQMWSADTGEALFRMLLFNHKPGLSAEVQSAAITSDGAYLVTATNQETRVWPIAGRLLQQTLRAAVHGCLPPSFRERLGEPADEARNTYKRCFEQLRPAPDTSQSSGAASAPSDAN